ncbi:hypothetical protein I5677_09085 [Mobilitalea sibirica]|uniref:Uncharacterized protein n=1 Tax=Mobilitalea sibirica TaxID=1462919 RepID=A0A8J7HDQ4_9FIRM|nr:hypothetical protein [Mobilitalea sibirica]MBH1941044.1 hypothetical protein [Mobilitalea sibirica]
MGRLFRFIGSILTLDVLPSAYEMTYNTAIKGNHTVWLIGWIINPIINYFITLFINIIDFLCVFTSWIPFVNNIQDTIYYAPDIDQLNSNIVYNIIEPLLGTSHRNWITHSVLNPYFIFFIVCAFILSFIARFIPVFKYIVGLIILIIGMSFVAHLLADTMPLSWGKGSRNSFSNIHVRFWFIKFQMNGLFSKLWLYLHASIAGAATIKASSVALEDD